VIAGNFLRKLTDRTSGYTGNFSRVSQKLSKQSTA